MFTIRLTSRYRLPLKQLSLTMLLKFKIYIVLLMVVPQLFAQPSEPKMTAKQYIELFKADAVREMVLFNIPASITLAQGMLESSFGNSDLAVYANNHFGIKCHTGWEGPTFIKDDDTKDECFRKYQSPLDSYTDHSNFLKTRSRYAPLFELKTTDYKGWAKGLKEVGYATDPKYPHRLIKLIEDYELYQFDKIESNMVAAILEEYSEKDKSKALIDKKDNTIATETKVTEMRSVRVISQFRFINYVLIKPGDTFYRIAKETDKDLWQLYKFNDLTPTDKLVPGERMYLQPKRRKAKEAYHLVKKGETMRSISQLYAVKLKLLYKKNHMQPGEEPLVGQTLYLRKTKK